MFGASASLLSKKSTFDRLPFFNSALLQQEGHLQQQQQQFKQDNGIESPPASLENRSVFCTCVAFRGYSIELHKIASY